MGNALASLEHLAAPPSPPTPLAADKFFWLPGVDARTLSGNECNDSLHGTKSGSRWIPVVHIAKTDKDGTDAARRQTLLYCHGHDVDLGLIHEFLVHMSKVLDVDILSFDYAGYGPARTSGETSGEASAESPCPLSEEQCHQDLLACYHYLVNEKNVSPRNIVVYGKSLGSGPACWLARKVCTEAAELAEREWMEGTLAGRDGEGCEMDGEGKGRMRKPQAPLGGLILHAAFLSLGDGSFRNLARLKEMHAGKGVGKHASTKPGPPGHHPGHTLPLYFIHGKQDSVVPIAHGGELNAMLMKERRRGFLPFWADSGTHWNIEHKYSTAYIKRLQQFLRHCDKTMHGESRERSTSRERDGALGGSSGRQGVPDSKDTAPCNNEGLQRTHRMPRGRDAQPDAKAPHARSKSRARQRKKRGTLVMRGAPNDDNEDVHELQSTNKTGSVGGKARRDCARSQSDSRAAEPKPRMVRESRDPPATKASF